MHVVTTALAALVSVSLLLLVFGFALWGQGYWDTKRDRDYLP